MKLGIYRLDGLLDRQHMAALEQELHCPVQVTSWYRAWNRCSIADDRAWLEELRTSSREILLSWEPWALPEAGFSPQDQPCFALQKILDGRFDTYIRAVSRVLKTFNQPLYLRPMHEMNGDWYPWCGTVNGNSAELFKRVWVYLRRLFLEEGATGPRWVWSPYVQSYPQTERNLLENYYPGDEWVDWLALDGYNWGSSQKWSRWQSFEDTFAEAYARLCRLSDRPIMIAETACSEQGGAKAAWIEEMFRCLEKRFSRVQLLVWFDVDKECDWRINSSADSAASFLTTRMFS